MSGEDDKAQSAFPPPPAKFYKAYTDDAVRNGQAPLPPPVPEGLYMTFGSVFQVDEDIIRPLESQGLRQLFPSENRDRIGQMRKLNHSILINFLDLVDILIHAPSSQKRDEKLNDLNLLFINLHHMINEFRPHQALEAVRVMMDTQRRQREQAIVDIQAHIKNAESVLQQCTPSLVRFRQTAEGSLPVDSTKCLENGDGVPMETDAVDDDRLCSEDIRALCANVDLIT